MAARLADHPWTMTEPLSYQVPLPAWVAPKHRGRPPKRPSRPMLAAPKCLTIGIQRAAISVLMAATRRQKWDYSLQGVGAIRSTTRRSISSLTSRYHSRLENVLIRALRSSPSGNRAKTVLLSSFGSFNAAR